MSCGKRWFRSAEPCMSMTQPITRGQTSGSMVSSSRPGAPRERNHLNPSQFLLLTEQKCFVFESEPVGLVMVDQRSVLLCALPELPLLLCKVVLLMLSLWCKYRSRLIKPTDISLSPPPCVFNPGLPSILWQIASSVAVSAPAILLLASEFGQFYNRPPGIHLIRLKT